MAANTACHFAVSNSLHLKGMHSAKITDLLEGKGSVLNQPYGGCFGH
jgi:hypothetical protein